jgi:hypothetical protein
MDSRQNWSPEIAPSNSSAASTSPIQPSAPADLESPAAEPTLTEDQALALLKQRDLPAETIQQLLRNPGVMKSRKVRL